MLLMLGLAACDRAPGQKPESIETTAANSSCRAPAQATVILEKDGAILETWALRLKDVANDVLPGEPAFLAYRAAIERDSADVLRPVADPPIVRTKAEEEMWQNEHFNNELVFSGGVGSIDRISCLDALLFARQASRISEIDHPTEFLASVLRRETSAGTDLIVVFGAGVEMFPPKAAYGFDVVNRLRAEGWSYWYAIHNHTVQKNGNRLALGVPAPSTSDVQFYRSLAGEMSLESLRVTNGFYTFSTSAGDLSAFRAR